MRCACVDIGSNTTRTLVADVTGEAVTEVVCEKAFTRLGTVLRATGALPDAALDMIARTVAAQLAIASELGAERVRAVATAAIRAARNADTLVGAVRERTGVEIDVLDGDEEARLAFLGATNGGDYREDVAVVDVGGGSTEIAVGTPRGGVGWARSVPIGSSSLTDLGGDLLAVARQVIGALRPPPVSAGLAVGGSAGATASLVGPLIDADSARGALTALAAGRHALEPERVRVLPAGLAILVAVSETLRRPLQVGVGGLREGVCLELGSRP